MHDPHADAARALRDFLVALGVPVDRDRELDGTPERVALAFHDELLDGYRRDPRTVLADALATEETGVVTVAGIHYASVCPHHLLPTWGRAHVGYLPGGRIVGVGALAQLVEVLAHRMVLQETLGRTVADALVEHLGARDAGVVLEARHACLSLRGERQAEATVVTQSFAGVWRDDLAARREFLFCVERGRPVR